MALADAQASSIAEDLVFVPAGFGTRIEAKHYRNKGFGDSRCLHKCTRTCRPAGQPPATRTASDLVFVPAIYYRKFLSFSFFPFRVAGLERVGG